MAWISGKVQLFEENESKNRSVGSPFARLNTDGSWTTMNGKPLKRSSLSPEELKLKIMKKKEKQNGN